MVGKKILLFSVQSREILRHTQGHRKRESIFGGLVDYKTVFRGPRGYYLSAFLVENVVPTNKETLYHRVKRLSNHSDGFWLVELWPHLPRPARYTEGQAKFWQACSLLFFAKGHLLVAVRDDVNRQIQLLQFFDQHQAMFRQAGFLNMVAFANGLIIVVLH